MHALPELQRAYARALWQNDDAIAARVCGDGVEPAQRIAIHRNNTLLSLTQALVDDYPVVHRLVGAEFFAYAAGRYIRRHPPTTGGLHDFGAGFAELLAVLPEAAGLPYLPDVARLERAWQEAYHAADAEPRSAVTLAAMPADRWGELMFQLHPSARLIASPWPVLPIWQVNQPDWGGDDRIDMAAGSSRTLVIRRDLQVELEALSAGTFAWLVALRRGEPLAAATAAGFTADPHFDLAASLADHLHRVTLTDAFLQP